MAIVGLIAVLIGVLMLVIGYCGNIYKSFKK